MIFTSNFRCEEFLRSREHIDLDLPPAQLWEHQWEQFLTEYYSLTQGGAKIQVRRPTRNFDLKTLKDNKNNAEFHHEIAFQYFIFFVFKIAIAVRGKYLCSFDGNSVLKLLEKR